MTCYKCGEALSEEAKFCSKCGARAKTVTETKAETAKRYAKVATDEVVDAGRSALKTKLGKEMALGAAAGALIAMPIPFIGSLTGAAVGAGIVAYKRYMKA